MKAKDVMKLLQISRMTLYRWNKSGLIGSEKMPNGHYNYSDDDVYAILNRDVERKTFIYARVSTNKQKKDLENQINTLKQWCFMNGYNINGVYSDIASGISFDKRKQFFEMLDEILDHRVSLVIITHKDRLSRVGFDLFSHLFKKFGTDIIVISEVGNQKLDSEEVFEEIVSLLHCYSMKMYSKRRNNYIEVGINDKD